MDFDKLKQRMDRLNIDIDQKSNGNIYFKRHGGIWVLLIPEHLNGKPALEFNSDCALSAKDMPDFLGMLRIVNKYMRELNQDPRVLFCQHLASLEVTVGDVVVTTDDDFLITQSGVDNYSVTDLSNSYASNYAVGNIDKIGLLIWDVEKKALSRDKLDIFTVYRSFDAYCQNMGNDQYD